MKVFSSTPEETVRLRSSKKWNAAVLSPIVSGSSILHRRRKIRTYEEEQSVALRTRKRWTGYCSIPVQVTQKQDGVYGVLNKMSLDQAGLHRIQNNVEGYVVYVGVDSLPDLTAPPSYYSAVLPISIPTTPPMSGTRTYNILVCKRDPYGLISRNQQCKSFLMDSSGGALPLPIPAPVNLSLYERAGQKVFVLAAYPTFDVDKDPATQWKVWAGATPPNTSLDAPATIVDVLDGYLGALIGPMTPGLVYVTVGLFRSLDSALSPTLSGSLTVHSSPDEVLAVPSGFDGD